MKTPDSQASPPYGLADILAKHGIHDNGSNHVDPGWLDLVDQAFGRMIEAGWPKQLGQVKQKFGGLRIYWDHYDANGCPISDGKLIVIQSIVDEAEALAAQTCEECGALGASIHKPKDKWTWRRTLCDGCVGP